jgi:ubiquinone biosynthesis protein
MKISSIPQIYRHVGRWTEILRVLSKYELAGWIGRLGPDFAKDLLKTRSGTAIARHCWETRVRLALAELGPTFIKLGQLLSTRPDVVGVKLADELQQLQANVPADPPETARQMVESQFNQPLEELFAQFDPQPLASASIGQVHSARLHSGEAVVVKVQHADIERKIHVDLDILAGLAQLAERIPEFQNFRPQAIVAEFQRSLRRELDFRRELRNMQQFARDFAHDATVHIPRAYPELSGSRVLTMEFLDGIKLSERERLLATGVDLDEVARRGARVCLEMIFGNGFFHADPHPGNILLMDGQVIGLLDFGMVGRIDEQMHEQIGEMLVAASNLDVEYLTTMITRIGAVPMRLDRSSLSLDVADFLSHYASVSMEQFDLSGALKELVEIIRRYHIMLPARITLLLKAIVTLEGTSRLVSPSFSLIEIMEPYRRKLLRRRYSPRRQLRKMQRLYSEMEHLVLTLPRGVGEIVEQIQSGRFYIPLDHRGLEPSVNRLVLGMLASALFVGSSLLLSRNVPPLIGQISVLGAAGYVTSIALGLRLWRAINKSGHLDRRK